MTTLVHLAGRTAGCLLAILLAQSFALPPVLAAQANDNDDKSAMKGRVETSTTRRVSRPSAALESGAAESQVNANASQSTRNALAGQIDSRSFTLDADESALQAGLNTDIMGGAAGEQDPPSMLRPVFSNQTPEQALAGINYADIERAYAQAVPPVLSGETPLQSALLAIRAQLQGVRGPAGTPLGAAAIDLDNCACGTAMPSHQCMGERTSAIYSGSYSSSPFYGTGATSSTFYGHGGGHCGGRGGHR